MNYNNYWPNITLKDFIFLCIEIVGGHRHLLMYIYHSGKQKAYMLKQILFIHSIQVVE